MKVKQIFQHSQNNPKRFFSFLQRLPQYIQLFSRLLRDKRVPFWPKTIFIGSIAYFLSPFDFLPEILFPVLGYTDDILIFFGAARLFLKSVPPELLAEHVEEIESKKVQT